MTKITTNIWSDVLARFHEARPELMRSWFAELRMREIAGGILSIEARNAAQRDYLDAWCRVSLSMAAQEVTGRLVTLAIDLAPDAATTSPFAEAPLNARHPNPALTFSTFVVGRCNDLAAAAARAITEDSPNIAGPLFIYGAAGSGKTHLLQAIAQAVRGRLDRNQVMLSQGDAFVQTIVSAIEDDRLDVVLRAWSQANVVVLDDVDRLEGRERSQSALFELFEALAGAEGRLVLSARRAPMELLGIQPRLTTRFSAGLVVPLEPPCLETRLAALATWAKNESFELPEPIARLIAESFEGSFAVLKERWAVIARLSAETGSPVSREVVLRAAGSNPIRVPLPAIINVVARRFELPASVILGRQRSRPARFAREISVYLSRSLTGLPLAQIGLACGNLRYEEAVLAAQSISVRAAQDPDLRHLLDELTTEANNAAC